MNQISSPGPETTQHAAAPEAPGKEKNNVGLIAFIVSVVGFIFACIPGALIVGWILLPIAFILAIVSLFLKDKKRGLGIAGLIISVVGTVVGVIVFFSVVATAFDDAFSKGETSVSTPAEDEEVTNAEDGAKEDTKEEAKEGTRNNPYPLGSAISDDDWTVTVNSVDLDANEAVSSANPFNDPSPEGQVYILANVTITYTGDDPAGEMPTQIIEYVTADGNTVNSYDTMAVAPDPLDSMTTLYEGASTTGNVVFSVPAESAGEGVLAVAPSMFSDNVFVAVK